MTRRRGNEAGCEEATVTGMEGAKIPRLSPRRNWLAALLDRHGGTHHRLWLLHIGRIGSARGS